MSDDRLDQLDYYTLLGLEGGKAGDALKEAFHRFALKYHPDRHSDGPPEKRERATQIYRRGAEAYRVLSDPNTKRAYDDQLARGKLRYDPTDRDAASERPTPSTGTIGTKNAKARPFLVTAQRALASGDFKTAKLNLKIAMQHDPENVYLTALLAEAEQGLGKNK